MKANRFLTPAELDQLDVYCEQIGEIYPRNFKKSIPPKLGEIVLSFFPTMFLIIFLDDLIFVVPIFARKWNTVGGLREENIG